MDGDGTGVPQSTSNSNYFHFQNYIFPPSTDFFYFPTNKAPNVFFTYQTLAAKRCYDAGTAPRSAKREVYTILVESLSVCLSVCLSHCGQQGHWHMLERGFLHHNHGQGVKGT